MPTLLTLPYSPWSEKARFALDHHGIAYDRVVHEPVVGELAWRSRTKRFTGRASVPVWLDGGTKLFDSFAIAEHADRTGSAEPTLFPDGARETIRSWNAASERALESGRRRSFVRMLRDSEVLEANLTIAPKAMRGPMIPVARAAIEFMKSKYDTAKVDDDDIVRELEALRAALGQGPYLLGQFTYADIAMAVVLQMVEPVSNTYLPIANTVRRSFRDAELAERFADLVRWRDAIYARHARAST